MINVGEDRQIQVQLRPLQPCGVYTPIFRGSPLIGRFLIIASSIPHFDAITYQGSWRLAM